MVKSRKSQTEKPLWLKYTEEEVKQIIIKLANKGLTSEKIGLVLRDQYGIPKVSLYNLKIKKILEEKNLFEDPTLKNLKNKSEKLNNHMRLNSHDQVGKRSQTITKSKLKKIQEYNEKD